MPAYRKRPTADSEDRITSIETNEGAVHEVYVNHGDGNGEQLVWTSDQVTLDAASYQYDAGDIRLDDDEPVETWPEAQQSFDATQSSNTAQPTFVTSGIGDNPTVSFAPDQWLEAGFFDQPLAQPYTFAAVVDYEPVTNDNAYVFYGADNTDRSFVDLDYRETGDTVFWAGTTGGVSLTTPTDPCVIIAVADGTNSVFRIDDVEATGDAGELGHAGLTIGAHTSGTRGMNGQIGELAIFDWRLTSSERTQIAQALAGKWNLSLEYTQ